jgi:DNA (cytosine-5)-methyltransferase 1
MSAIVRRAGATVDAIDVFCGFGGSSQGIHKAGADVRVAANHNQLAIECHAANFPDVDHWRADLVDSESGDYVDAADLPPARFAWFSPGCTHHSPANAQKLYERGRQAGLFDEEDFDQAAFARSERSRVTMSCVLRYVERNRPELLVVENVCEVAFWGPGRDGTTFAWWKRTLENLDYEVECCFFNSQFFPPCPQSRDRIYIVAWRRGNRRPDLDYRPIAYCDSGRCGGRIGEAVQSWKRPKKTWPLPRWGKYGIQYVYRCSACGTEVEPAAWPAFTSINWKNLGPMLCERESLGMKMLAPNTVARVRRAVAKFGAAPPVVMPAKSVWGTERPVGIPFGAQTTQQDKALVVPIGAWGTAHPTDAPFAVQTTLQDKALVSASVVPLRTNNLPLSVMEPTNPLTCSGGGGHTLVTALVPQRNNNAPISVCEQLNSLATHGDQSLVSVVVPAAGNTYESGEYVRARHPSETLFTQHTSQAFGFATMPVLIEMRGGGSVESGQHPVTEPAHTVTAGGLHHGLTTPCLFAKFNGGPNDTAWHATTDPLNTVTAADTHGLVFLPGVEQVVSDPITITRQFAALMAHLRKSVAETQPLPLEAVTEEMLMRARFRMLEPDPELRRAMAFADSYVLLGNKTEMTAGLGNAVTPPVAEWITERCLATLR